MPAIGLTPICFTCARLRGVTPELGLVCEAFGADRAIPVDILASAANHRKPFPGDNGLQYEARVEGDMPITPQLDAGTSEGAKKGWLHRQRGRLVEASKQKIGGYAHEDAKILREGLHKPNSEPRKHLASKLTGLAKSLPTLLKSHLKEEKHHALQAAGALRSLGTGQKPTPEQLQGLRSFGLRILMSAASMALTGDATGTVGHLATGLGHELVHHVIAEHTARAAAGAARVVIGKDQEQELSPEDIEALQQFIADLAKAAIELDVPDDRAKELFGGPDTEGEGLDGEAILKALAADKPVSEAQRRAMWAAAGGKSKLGIPTSVGKEFAEADPGGSLPERARDMSRGDWRGGLRWLLKFFVEEMAEPEHQEQDQHGAAAPRVADRGAGVAFITKDGQALFLKRSASGDHEGEWCFPGGAAEGEEDPLATARREAAEETGHDCQAMDCPEMQSIDHTRAGDKQFMTFGHLVDEAFEPKINDEHTEFAWKPLTDPPDPLHPAVKATVDKMLKALAASADAPAKRSGELSETTREKIGDPGSEKREDMPESAFLLPAEKLYPVQEKRDGEWKYTRNLLLAAARRARLQGRGDLARKADAIREREFGSEENETHDIAVDTDPDSGAWEAIIVALAMDRASERRYDDVGRLHVDEANISKATVNPYRGKEINEAQAGKPGWKDLDPNKTYMLLRHPDELRKAAHTANGLPLLFVHKATSADDHPAEITVGSLGDNARFDPPYLKNSLHVWPQYAISAVEDGLKRQVSAGYAYTCDLTPGVYNGMPYDGIMRDLSFNHISLVSEGRAGPDVAVDTCDEDPDSRAWAIITHGLLAVSRERADAPAPV